MKLLQKKWVKITLAVLLILAAVWGALFLFPRAQGYKGENPLQKPKDSFPLLIAHGGGNKEFPDNTLEAFYNAYHADTRVMMETDVSITKDGVVILSHDTTLDRKTNVTGNIIDWNYSDLIKDEVDFGYTNPTDENDRLSGAREKFKNPEGVESTPLDVPYPPGIEPRHKTVFLATTLEQLLSAFPESLINVEIKQSGETGQTALKAVLALLEKYDAFDRVVVASFHEEIYDTYLELKKEQYPDLLFSPATDATTAFFIEQMLGVDVLFTDPVAVFQVPMEEMGFTLATKGFVKAAHKHNVAVHYWTVNDPNEMRYLVDIGADGIMTDYPHRLAEVYNTYEQYSEIIK